VLAVVDDVEAGLGLALHDFGDAAPHALIECGLVVALGKLLYVEGLNEIGRPRQAAGMGGENFAYRFAS
jgi:hypothetical protein